MSISKNIQRVLLGVVIAAVSLGAFALVVNKPSDEGVVPVAVSPSPSLVRRPAIRINVPLAMVMTCDPKLGIPIKANQKQERTCKIELKPVQQVSALTKTQK